MVHVESSSLLALISNHYWSERYWGVFLERIHAREMV